MKSKVIFCTAIVLVSLISLPLYAGKDDKKTKSPGEANTKLTLENLDIRKSSEYQDLVGCHCWLDKKIYVEDTYGGAMHIQIDGKVEKLESVRPIDKKRINETKDKHFFAFALQMANAKYVMDLRCEEVEIKNKSEMKCESNDESCRAIEQKCDVDLNGKDGKKMKTLKGLKGQCLC